MKVTICELGHTPGSFEEAWGQLVEHVGQEASNLVLLPEMPFSPWCAGSRNVDATCWEASVSNHGEWLERLDELAPAVVLGSRPVNKDQKRLNEAFVWDQPQGYAAVHSKYYLPDEEGFWEATWYDRGDGKFEVAQRGEVKFGFLICTEMWFMQQARAYGQSGIQILAVPRATPQATVEKWFAGGMAAAVISGAFCLSSNHGGIMNGSDLAFGGRGWVIGPDGDLLAVTSPEAPIATVEIDLHEANRAKETYPRYVPE